MSKRKSHYPKTLPKWKAKLGLAKNEHHRKVPIVAELLWLVLENIGRGNYERYAMFVLSGEMDAGMYQSYINLLCRHGLIRRLKRHVPLAVQVKGKRWIIVKASRHMLTAKAKAVLK